MPMGFVLQGPGGIWSLRRCGVNGDIYLGRIFFSLLYFFLLLFLVLISSLLDLKLPFLPLGSLDCFPVCLGLGLFPLLCALQ